MNVNDSIRCVIREELEHSYGEDINYQRLETVLLIEDDESLNETLVRRLAAVGLNVAVARDGVTAIEKIRALEPDVVLLDLGLPRMSGPKLLHLLRQTEAVAAPPVIVITGDPSVETEARVRGFGVSGYYHKPLSPRRIAQAVLREIDGV